MMPEKYIRRIGEEMWEGMKVSARYARKSELGPSKAAEKEELNERRWLAQNIQDQGEFEIMYTCRIYK